MQQFEGTRHYHIGPKALRDQAAKKPVRLVHISDTHNRDYADIPMGDILIHTGDFTNEGLKAEVDKFASYLHRLPHKHKVVICGNHELGLDRISMEQLTAVIGRGDPSIFVLQESEVVVRGVKFYGAAWSNCERMAWGLSAERRRERWELIPPDTDVLLTHNPPLAQFDLAWVSGAKDTKDKPCSVCQRKHPNYSHWGDYYLGEKCRQLKIPFHCFGHVHDQVGIKPDSHGPTIYSNAAMDIHKKGCVLDVLVTDDTVTWDRPKHLSSAPAHQTEQQQATAAPAAKQPQSSGASLEQQVLVFESEVAPNHVLDLDIQDPKLQQVLLYKSWHGANQRWISHPTPTVAGLRYRFANAEKPDRFLIASPGSERTGGRVECSGSGRGESEWIIEEVDGHTGRHRVRLAANPDLALCVSIKNQGALVLALVGAGDSASQDRWSITTAKQ